LFIKGSRTFKSFRLTVARCPFDVECIDQLESFVINLDLGTFLLDSMLSRNTMGWDNKVHLEVGKT